MEVKQQLVVQMVRDPLIKIRGSQCPVVMVGISVRLGQATSDLALLLSKATCERDGKSAKPQATSRRLDKLHAMGYYRI